MKYHMLTDGEEFEVYPSMRLMCCDCGLTHNIATSIAADGKVKMTLDRNNRSTAALRRSRDFGLLAELEDAGDLKSPD